jgi:glycine cleavage system H protein
MTDDYRFTIHHVWTSPEHDGSYAVGITDYAQEMLGDMVFVDAPEVGARLVSEEPCGLIESVKTASDLHAPIAGVVVETNPELKSKPEVINEQPYEAWIFRFVPDHAVDLDNLMSAAEYQAYLK